MLDYKLIEALAMVVQEGGFENAATRLHITQSAVSQRIKLLEEQTGRVLLARTSPPRPTTAGQQMIKHFQQVKRLEEDLVQDVYDLRDRSHVTLSVGLNGDSLSTWFLEAVTGFISRHPVLLDLRSDDQEQTLKLLKNGDVIGCISAKEKPLQGCMVDLLGVMTYRMLARPDFVDRWFSTGFDAERAAMAPLVIFNRKDALHVKYFETAFGSAPNDLTAHYLPSASRFLDFISRGLAYGMLPDQQSMPMLKRGRLVEVRPGCTTPVALYWHRWNLKSPLLEAFSRHLIQAANRLLARPSSTA